MRQADALCLDFRDAVMGASLAYQDASARERARIRRRLAAKGRRIQKKVEALPPPQDEDRELLDPLFKKMRKQLALLRAGKQGEVPGMDRLADRYGFDVCGRTSA